MTRLQKNRIFKCFMNKIVVIFDNIAGLQSLKVKRICQVRVYTL